jgi:hypothetical protein
LRREDWQRGLKMKRLILFIFKIKDEGFLIKSMDEFLYLLFSTCFVFFLSLLKSKKVYFIYLLIKRRATSMYILCKRRKREW